MGFLRNLYLEKISASYQIKLFKINSFCIFVPKVHSEIELKLWLQIFQCECRYAVKKNVDHDCQEIKCSISFSRPYSFITVVLTGSRYEKLARPLSY